MPCSPRLAVAAAVLASGPSVAMDDDLRASSSAPTAIRLCGDGGSSTIKTADCRKAGTDRLVTQIDRAFDPALGKMPANVKPKADAAAAPARPPSLKLRRQGETLRIVGSIDEEEWDGFADCSSMWQVTGSYFAAGKDTASDRADTAFVVPTFDCTRPETATDEEICADPDLADNDRRLNRAWKALQPHLDEATRRALIDDQRSWVKSQTQQYPEFLHPAWNKQSSQVHFTVDARDHVDELQRERLALLKGFDDKRSGLAGIWLAHNAIIKITTESNGAVKATGWKWDQGDWKAGCDYEMTGKIVGGTFRSDEQRKNPDTLERDHAMLIVNRQDDLFAKKHYSNKDGTTENKDADEAKCKRRLDNSSTARLFPARPSPDIDNFKGSIR
ncbi:lysozyme inhibitor LprI family protein [Bradyrhizobium sp. USDA 3315]